MYCQHPQEKTFFNEFLVINKDKKVWYYIIFFYAKNVGYVKNVCNKSKIHYLHRDRTPN